MDRWGDGDGLERGPKQQSGAVAKYGMASFVKSSQSMGSETTGQEEKRPKIEVVASRREQKRQQMPPPPARGPKPPAVAAAALPEPAAAPAPGAFRPPAWAGQPPPGAVLEVLKGGQLVERVTLDTPATLFGRSPAADVVLDHPSISRQHAAVCYQRGSGGWVLLDLDSAHGTFLGGSHVSKGVPVELTPGAVLRFAASSRDYVLRLPHAPAQQPEEGAGAHRKRAAEEPEEAPSKRHEGDGAAAAPHVGPAPAEEGAAGRFQGLVQSRVVQGGGAAPKQALAGQALQQRRPKPEPERGRGHPGAQPFVKPSMYDWIPPVSGAGSSSSSTHAL